MNSTAALARAPRGPKASPRARVPEKFADAEKLYGIENWGKGFFSVSDESYERRATGRALFFPSGAALPAGMLGGR